MLRGRNLWPAYLVRGTDSFVLYLQTMMDLVDKITDADSAAVIERCGNELLERMSDLKNARSRITEEEMAIVMRERDDAVARVNS